jgi:hypothetical protein
LTTQAIVGAYDPAQGRADYEALGPLTRTDLYYLARHSVLTAWYGPHGGAYAWREYQTNTTDQPSQPATATEGKQMIKTGDYVIVRTSDAGVFAGTLASRDGAEATLTDARRLWYWAGAASLSQLAVEGTSRPGGCKFPPEVPVVTLLGVVELLAVTAAARTSIAEVPVWRS